MRSHRSQRRIIAAGLAATAALAAVGCGSSGPDRAGGSEKAKPIVLTFANGNGDTLELDAFAAAVRQLSHGTVRIAFKNDWRHGSTTYEKGVIRDVAAGKADLGWSGARAFDDVGVTSFDALVTPLLIDSYALERRVLQDRTLIGGMLDGMKPAGVVGIGVLPGPMRKPLGVEPLVRPADYRGRTIALQRSRVGAMALRALGAGPVNLSRGGPIDHYGGVEQHVGSIAANQYDRVAPYLTANVNLWPRPIVLVANGRALARLSASQRKALGDAARVAVPGTLASIHRDERESADDMCRRGTSFLTATPHDMQELRAAVDPVYTALDGTAATRAAIARIAAMHAEMPDAAASEAPVCRRPATASTAGRPTPIDGAYRFHSTAEQLRAIGTAESDINPENYGTSHFVFDRGRWTFRHSSGDTAEGTYTVNGDTFTMLTTAGAGGVAKSKPGEQFTFRWSRFRDLMTLKPVRGADSPGIWRVVPWRRIGAASSGSAGPPRTPIDGVWRMTDKSTDSDPPASPANYGTWTYVFDRGHFAISQHNADACTWAYGTYTVNGHRTRWNFEDGGGRTPDNAYNKPGERFDYTWSRFRDQLTLGAVRGAISPGNFKVHPLRKVSATPARRYLDRRCLPPAAALPDTQ
jgi:TRAP-type C4-dicarboxylate transport system substrate-binding protein